MSVSGWQRRMEICGSNEMKYEITKGSENDFEGAPENAMVRIAEIGVNDCISIFADKLENGSTRTHRYSGSCNSRIVDASNWTVIAERRPITEPVWDGEGLPPVGVECEILWNDDWVKCVVKAYGEEQLIFKAEESREWAGHINNYKFRPIRSPEDVAKDEAISEMVGIYFNHGIPGKPNREDYESMAALYDAGYRKLE